MQHLNKAGSDVGIQFNKDRKMFSTIDSHRVMEWCNQTTPDKSDALMEAFFSSYFEQADNICDVDVLCRVAASIGLSGQDVRGMLASDSYREEVIQKDREAKALRVSGVPYFIVSHPARASATATAAAGRSSSRKPVTFSGAQPIDVISEMLTEVTAV